MTRSARRPRRPLSLALALSLAAGAAHALEVEGVEFPAQVEVAPGAAPLVLSGAGVRRILFFDVYAIGLYLPARAASADAAIAALGRKRVALQLLRDVEAAEFVEALGKGLRANHDEAAMRALAPSVARLEAIVGAEPLKKGTRVVLDFAPGSGTAVAIDGAARGAIPDEAFFPALCATGSVRTRCRRI